MATSRPLSPHLSIWKWRPTMAVSIFHRVTGNALGLAGLLLFAWWLLAAASGEDAYWTFVAFASSAIGWLIWVGLSWALFQHLLSGLRHLVMDAGVGYGLEAARRSSILVFVGAILLTALFWAAFFFGPGYR
jgi:succinate dehydrogenase / fumarate reductase cytochrome b subunit